MRHHNKILLIAVCLWLGHAQALPEDKEQPIQLAADSVDLDQGQGTSVYRGDVDLRQGSMRLQADTVTVQHRDSKPNRILASGQVRFSQDTGRGPVQANAEQAEYQVDSEILELTGNASLIQAGDRMQSDKIIYDRVRHKVMAGAAAQGKQRVQITIQPPQQ